MVTINITFSSKNKNLSKLNSLLIEYPNSKTKGTYIEYKLKSVSLFTLNKSIECYLEN